MTVTSESTSSSAPLPSIDVLADSPSSNLTLAAELAPIPIRPTLNTTFGLFKLTYDSPANLSARLNGSKHDFKDGRDFIYTPVDIEIDADIEVNIIVQEFCDICTDRSNHSDFHIYTIVFPDI
jgi:hypothetical protein